MIRKAVPSDLFAVKYQDEQAHALAQLTAIHAEFLCARGEAWALTRGHDVLACAGVVPFDEAGHRGLAWALISGRVGGPGLVEMALGVKRRIGGLGYGRVEAFVRCGFVRGVRFARACGFVREAPRMRNFMADGSDYELWAWVNG